MSQGDAAYVDPTVRLYGDVTFAEGTSIWPNAVLRAESNFIRIGAFTNIQDFVMVHVGYTSPTVVGAYCSITHHATLHGCTIGDDCLIGIGATVMDGADIEAGSVVAGHAFVREGTQVPPNSIVMGTPAKVVDTRDSFIGNRINAHLYHRNALAYARGDHRAWTGPEYDTWFAGIEAEVAAERARRAGGL